MVGSGGFEPPTSSASERRSPTELRAYPEYRSCYTALCGGVKRGSSNDRGLPENIRQRRLHDIAERGVDRHARLAERVRNGRKVGELHRVDRVVVVDGVA